MDPYDLLRATASAQDGLVTAGQALACGVGRSDIATRCRRREWRSLARGVYLLDADMYGADIPVRTVWRAALLTHGPGFCLVAGAGAQALGLEGLPYRLPVVEVAAIGGPSRVPRAAAAGRTGLQDLGVTIVVRQFPVTAEQVVCIDGLLVRDAFHTVVDAALGTDRATGLALLDSALHRTLITKADLLASVELSKHRPGIVAVRELAGLADARAESQVESRVRLTCIDGGVPPDELQFEVRDADRHVVAIGDIAWLARRGRPLIAEADGESVHSLPEAVFRDRTRGNALVAQACDTVRFTFADTFRRGYIPYVVKNALRAG